MYKYIIRNYRSNDNKKYIPYINYKNNWKYLIKSDDKFMVSNRTKMEYDKLFDAYRFVASHRMLSNLKGKNRLKCLYFKDGISLIPIIGIFYTLPKILNKIPIKYLFTSPLSLIMSGIIQFLSILFIILLFIL